MHVLRLTAFLPPLAALAAACSSRRAPSPEERAIAAVAASASAHAEHAARAPRQWALPSGPRLAILPGRGVGPIRIGATVGTIERLMDKRCEVRTEELCRYVSRGVDFHLQGGVTSWIHVQRAGRPAGVDFKGERQEFGFFNGAIPPDLRLGMLPGAIQEYMGPPERIEPVAQPNPTGLVSRDYYPGAVLEYDRYANGKIILGGVRIMKDPDGRPGYDYAPPPPASAAAPARPASDVVR